MRQTDRRQARRRAEAQRGREERAQYSESGLQLLGS